MNFELNNRIKILNKYSNIDALYGPYNSIEDACSAIPEDLRGYGLTVGVMSGNVVKEYWWKSGTDDSQLVEKNEQVELSMYRIGQEEITVQEGGQINLRFNVSGRAAISRGLLYSYNNGQEIFMQEFTNVTKGDNNVLVNNPSTSGVYVYRLKVADTAGYNAKDASTDLDYIQYTVQYGGISINVNTSNFDKIKIKNVQSVAGQYFTANISVRDDSFRILRVELYENEGGNMYNLPPYKTLTEPNNTFLGFNYYILPGQDDLEPFDGKKCYVRIIYIQDGQQKMESVELFTLLKISSLDFIPQTVSKDYYINFPEQYKFQLQSGVANLSVYVTADASSDFSFEPVTVNAYNTYSLRIVPKAVKQNATLSINCVFYMNNVQYTYNFMNIIGNILEMPSRSYYVPPTGSTISMDMLVDAEEGDMQEEGRYYKIIDATEDGDPGLTSEYSTCAFIADFYCRIPLMNDKTLKYIRILQGNSEIGAVTEDLINCNGIVTDTPLNEWMQIGLGYNLEETVTRSGIDNTARYFAIYINGMIVKNIQIDGKSASPLVYDQDKPITIELSNGINVSKAIVYKSDSRTQFVNPKADIHSIIYTNYLAHVPNFDEPGNLPVLKMKRITDTEERRYYFELIKQQNEDLTHLTIFGTIGAPKAINNMSEYDPSYGDNAMDHDSAMLFRQSVNIKKPALKAYATLCRGLYIVNGQNLLQDCIVEVHTQGTSTLVYPVPNFKFTFWKETNGVLEHFNPEFISDGQGGYYDEYVYTAKADFMDSSHLNNTPTCNFYNTLIHNLIDDNVKFEDFEGSPSARNGGIDAIMGFPIVLEISDYADSMDGDFLNIGSFMLNVDKTGNSLGFEVLDEQETLSCISFEGTSNTNEDGEAGRFINLLNLDYFESDEDIDTEYTKINTAIAESGKKLDLDTVIDGVKVRDYNYVKWCAFLSDGLEYRYPDSDIYKTSGNNLTKIMKSKDFKKLYRMWSWVSKSDDYSESKYRAEFENYFDLDYCMLYFVQVMIFAQTDNLGKNAMFDCWDGEHWYPRPYDLDSLAGLDNNGNDNIAPFVEIKPEFSLNYDPTYTREEMEAEYLIEDPDGTVSLIEYGGQKYDRYHFSSNTSKLWINFYKNYKTLINGFYRRLREDGNYTPEAIMSLCQNSLIDVLGVDQYNQDFQNKYLATTYQNLALGNRWYKFKKWMTQRFAFCDSYFSMGDTALYGLTSIMPEYKLELESPQYVLQSYQDANVKPYFVVGSRNMPGAGSGAATKFTLSLGQNQVLSSGHFKYVRHENGSNAYTGLIKLDVSGNRLINSIVNLVGTNISKLKELNISNSSVNTLNEGIPASLRKLIAQNVTLNTIVFPEGCLVEEINLTGSTINENINFSSLPNLKRLILNNCTFNANILLSDLPKLLRFEFSGVTFKGNVIISNNVNIDEFSFANIKLNQVVFTGNSVNVKKLNFIDSQFAYNSINLNAIADALEEIYFNNCTGLEHIELNDNIQFGNLKVFSIAGSSIKSLGTNTDNFDASKFDNLSNKMMGLRKVASYDATTRIPSSYNAFTFYNTKVVNIVNLNWNGTGYHLFRDCYNLTTINGTLNITNSIDYMFYRCGSLTTIPANIDINDNVTTATYTFAACHSLGYNNIERIIAKCKRVTDFTYSCYAIKFPNNTTISLTNLFANNTVVTTLNRMFTTGGWGGELEGLSNTFRVIGTIPSTVQNADYMISGPVSNTLTLPYNLLENATDLTSAVGMFYNTNITFYEQTSTSGNNMSLPKDDDVNLTDAIDNRFFYHGANNTHLLNILGMFQFSNVQPANANIFKSLQALKNCNAVFKARSPKMFRYELVIDNMWDSNPQLTTVAGCFANVLNVTCNGSLRFNSSVTSIDISGLFGCDNKNDSSSVININIDDVFKIDDNHRRSVTFDDYYAYCGNTYEQAGVFHCRKVFIRDNDNSILSALSSNCRRLFFNADLYISDNVNTFDLTNVKNCQNMFYGCKTYRQNAENIYDDTTRWVINVILPTACSQYENMFRGSQILKSLPNFNSASASNAAYMFANAYIHQDTVELSPTYFQICKQNISNVSHMFDGNLWITSLGYNSDCGLFEGCINLSNVTYMFYNCAYLHKGIPTNMFGTTNLPKITTLAYMFNRTNIWYDVDDESVGGKKWMDSSTIAPLINLTSIEGMFGNNRIGNASSGYGSYRDQVKNMDDLMLYIIATDTFAATNLQNIRYLFKNTSVINIPLEFNKIEYGEEAFFASPITEISTSFINETNLSSVINVSRMFYKPTWISADKTVDNLGMFVNQLLSLGTAKLSNIAGRLSNTDVPEVLKEAVADEGSISWVSPSGRAWFIIN